MNYVLCINVYIFSDPKRLERELFTHFPFQINFAFGLRMGVRARGVGSFTAGPLALAHNLGTFLSTNAETENKIDVSKLF